MSHLLLVKLNVFYDKRTFFILFFFILFLYGSSQTSLLAFNSEVRQELKGETEISPHVSIHDLSVHPGSQFEPILSDNPN